MVAKPMANSDHIRLVLRLAPCFDAYCRTFGGVAGPEGSVLLPDPDDPFVYLPDMAYWAPGRRSGHYPVTPPTLAIEVRSPSQTMAELRRKCLDYRQYGVDAVWLVDPDSRTVEVFEDSQEGLRVEHELISVYLLGFSLLLEELLSALDSPASPTRA